MVNGGECWRPPSRPLAGFSNLVQHLDETLIPPGDRTAAAARRRLLARKDAQTIAKALHLLKSSSSPGKAWYILEGPSRPDALLETRDSVICVEGKRTERACTVATQWMRNRSQLLRHMDAAAEKFRGKRVYGLLIVEGIESDQPSEYWHSECDRQTAEEMVIASLPHRTPSERSQLAAGVLGVTTWQAVCRATAIDWATLPDEV